PRDRGRYCEQQHAQDHDVLTEGAGQSFLEPEHREGCTGFDGVAVEAAILRAVAGGGDAAAHVDGAGERLRLRGVGEEAVDPYVMPTEPGVTGVGDHGQAIFDAVRRRRRRGAVDRAVRVVRDPRDVTAGEDQF